MSTISDAATRPSASAMAVRLLLDQMIMPCALTGGPAFRPLRSPRRRAAQGRRHQHR